MFSHVGHLLSVQDLILWVNCLPIVLWRNISTYSRYEYFFWGMAIIKSILIDVIMCIQWTHVGI